MSFFFFSNFSNTTYLKQNLIIIIIQLAKIAECKWLKQCDLAAIVPDYIE
jgi:hypothetical protein